MKRAGALCASSLLFLAGCGGKALPPHVHRIDPPAAPGAMTPKLTTSGEELLLSWFEPEGDGRGVIRFSRLEQDGASWRWGTARRVIEGDSFFANWADFPSIQQGSGGELLAHWLERLGDGAYTYGVALASSRDGGTSWHGLGMAHADTSATEHGFASLIPEGDGFRAFWLDGRDTGADGHAGAMALRTALVVEGVRDEERLDARVCDCCQTSAVRTAGGPIVVYRDRSDDEIRDIAIVRRDGDRWTDPSWVAHDGWKVPGCPVNGPAVAADQDGRRLAVTWFTAAHNEPRVQVALSDDGGASFSPPIVVDDDGPVGRAAVTMDASGAAIVAWLGGGSDQNAPLLLSRIAAGPGAAAHVGARIGLATTSSSRSSGFPQIARAGGGVVVAWTEPGNPGAIRARWVPDAVLGDHAAGSDAAREASQRPWDGRPGSLAPPYDAIDPAGNRVELASLRGSPVLLNVWATWCGPCRREMPLLVRLHERHAAAGLRIVGVSVDAAASRSDVLAVMSRDKIPYTILMDPDDRATSLFRVSMLPTTFLFDARGVLVWRRDGALSEEDAELNRAIAAASGSTARSTTQ